VAGLSDYVSDLKGLCCYSSALLVGCSETCLAGWIAAFRSMSWFYICAEKAGQVK